jgi:hypothetical protein
MAIGPAGRPAMTKLALLLGSAVIIGYWAMAWFHPTWGFAGLFVLGALLWLLTRERAVPVAAADAGPTTQPAISVPPPADERRHWADLPPAVRERLGRDPGPGHEIWAGVRPDAAGEPRTEWRVVDARGQVVKAFWLDA